MKIKYKKLKFNFLNLLTCLLFIVIASPALISIAAAIITKDDVVINDNYKGKKILVKHYYIFNKDSIYLAYNKPETYNIKIKEITNSKHVIVTLNNGEVWKAKIRNARQYKVGQTLTVTKKYYPRESYTIKGGETIYWKGKISW